MIFYISILGKNIKKKGKVLKIYKTKSNLKLMIIKKI